MKPRVEEVPEVGLDTVEINRERRVFGRKNIVEVPLSIINVCAQVRDTSNPELDRLQELIDAGDLINQIDLAYLSPEEFKAYLMLNNAMWRANQQVEDFVADDNGWFYLVIAGHNRLLAMQRIGGLGADDTADCKVEISPSPEKIIAIQLAENTYSKPAEERKAMAIVEMYKFGRIHGKWKSKKDFLEKNSKISRDSLDMALHFADLPAKIQQFVYDRTFPYRNAADLGKAIPTLSRYFGKRYLNTGLALEETDGSLAELDALIFDWLLVEGVAHIQNEHLNGPAASKYIQARINNMEAEMKATERNERLPFEMASAEISRREYRHQLHLKLERYMREFTGENMQLAANVLMLYGQLHPNGEAILADLEATVKKTLGHLGSSALKSSEVEVDEAQMALG